MHNGPVRFIFKGDPNIGQQYIRIARKYISIWNSFSKAPVWRRVLPDGARLKFIRLPNNNFTVIINVEPLEQDVFYRGIVCIPASNDSSSGWGEPFVDGDSILGTIGGNYPETILKDSEVSEYKPSRYPDWGTQFPEGLEYERKDITEFNKGFYDWKGEEEETLTHSGPPTRTLISSSIYPYLGLSGDLTPGLRASFYGFDTIYRNGKILTTSLPYKGVACAVTTIGREPSKRKVLRVLTQEDGILSPYIDTLRVYQANIPKDGSTILLEDFEQIGGNIVQADHDPTTGEGAYNPCQISAWMFNASGTEVSCAITWYPEANGNRFTYTPTIIIGSSDVEYVLGDNQWADYGGRPDPEYISIGGISPIAVDYIGDTLVKAVLTANLTSNKIEYNGHTLTIPFSGYCSSIYILHFDLRSSLIVYLTSDICPATDGTTYLIINKDGAELTRFSLAGFVRDWTLTDTPIVGMDKTQYAGITGLDGEPFRIHGNFYDGITQILDQPANIPRNPRFNVVSTTENKYLLCIEDSVDIWLNFSDFIEPVDHMSVPGENPRFLEIGLI